MTYPILQNAVDVILPIRIVDDAGDPILGLTFETVGFVIAYKRVTDTSWQTITLVAGTEGTYIDGGIVEEASGDGWYQLGLPAAAKVAGEVTRIRVQTTGNEAQYGPVAATALAEASIPTDEAIATRVAELISSLRISVTQQVNITGDDLEFVRGDDYVAHPVRVDLDTSGLEVPLTDFSAYRLVLTVYSGETEAIFAIAADIIGTAGEQYALFAPPSTLTETWDAGTFNLLYRIEYDVNKYWTIQRNATFRVLAADTDPEDIVDVTSA